MPIPNDYGLPPPADPIEHAAWEKRIAEDKRKAEDRKAQRAANDSTGSTGKTGTAGNANLIEALRLATKGKHIFPGIPGTRASYY
jgi:hypothetical protein